MQVSPSLVKRQKTHFHDLPCGASIILGNNGFIWIYPTPEQKEEDAGGFVTNLEVSWGPWGGWVKCLILAIPSPPKTKTEVDSSEQVPSPYGFIYAVLVSKGFSGQFPKRKLACGAF